MNLGIQKKNSRDILIFARILPITLLVSYGLFFTVSGTDLLWRLDISFSTFRILRAVCCFVPTGIFLLWAIIGNIWLSRGKARRMTTILESIVLLLIAVVLAGSGFQERMWAMEKFRIHDSRKQHHQAGSEIPPFEQ